MKVGIIGVLIGIVFTLLYRVVWFGYFESSSYDTTLLVYQLGLLNHFSFIGIVFTSVGYVGIFSMKNSKIGIVFPLIAIISHWGFLVYLNFLFQNGLYTLEIHHLSSDILYFVMAIIGGLALLTLRGVSANPQFLYIFVIFSILDKYLAALLSIVLDNLLAPFLIGGGLGNLIYYLPYLSINLLMALLIVKFFLLESKQGCIEEHEILETPFSE